MSKSYHPAGEDDASMWLDEFLCEYADGTMDPSVQDVFEEYLRANPEVADYAERLRCTRVLLCHHGCRLRAPQGLQARVRQRLSCEMMQTQRGPLAAVTARLGILTLFASAAAVMLIAGMLVGPTLLPSTPAPQHMHAEGAAPVQASLRYDQPSPSTAFYRSTPVPVRPAGQAYAHSPSRYGSASIVRSLVRQRTLESRPFSTSDSLVYVVASK